MAATAAKERGRGEGRGSNLSCARDLCVPGAAACGCRLTYRHLPKATGTAPPCGPPVARTAWQHARTMCLSRVHPCLLSRRVSRRVRASRAIADPGKSLRLSAAGPGRAPMRDQ